MHNNQNLLIILITIIYLSACNQTLEPTTPSVDNDFIFEI